MVTAGPSFAIHAVRRIVTTQDIGLISRIAPAARLIPRTPDLSATTTAAATTRYAYAFYAGSSAYDTIRLRRWAWRSASRVPGPQLTLFRNLQLCLNEKLGIPMHGHADGNGNQARIRPEHVLAIHQPTVRQHVLVPDPDDGLGGALARQPMIALCFDSTTPRRRWSESGGTGAWRRVRRLRCRHTGDRDRSVRTARPVHRPRPISSAHGPRMRVHDSSAFQVSSWTRLQSRQLWPDLPIAPGIGSAIS